MKLLYRITLRISLAVLVLLAAWGTFFYYIIIDEINDETDDSLEDYSEFIITRALAGEELPSRDNGTNNSYFLVDVDTQYALSMPAVRYMDEMVYIYSKRETEPARTLKTIFKDREGHYFELTVMIPTIEKHDLQQTILSWIITLYFILLLAIVAVNAFVLRHSLRPLYALLDWLDKLKLGRAIPPIDIDTDITEYRKLAESLLRSAQRNAEVYEQQSLFIGHASHELQTPLAISLNRLEMLANDPGMTEPLLEQTFKIKKSLADISRLNKTLLLLTKIENRQFPDSEEIDVNGLLRPIAADLAEAYEYRNLDIRITEDAYLNIVMNRTLAGVLFGNLLKNACIHSRENGKVAVDIRPHGVTISNSAAAGALNPEYIFRPFYKGTGAEGSSGLGLSLVVSICKFYGMSIAYVYDDGMHRFTVGLPGTSPVSK